MGVCLMLQWASNEAINDALATTRIAPVPRTFVVVAPIFVVAAIASAATAACALAFSISTIITTAVTVVFAFGTL